MKLYSRGQLIFYSLATGLLVVLLAVGFGLIGFQRGEQAAAGAAREETRVFELETNPLPPENTYLARSDNGYSEEELENIQDLRDPQPGGGQHFNRDPGPQLVSRTGSKRRRYGFRIDNRSPRLYSD